MSSTQIYGEHDNLTEEAEELLILLDSLEPASLLEIASLYESHPFDDDDINQAMYLLADTDVVESGENLKRDYFKRTRTYGLLNRFRAENFIRLTDEGYELVQDLSTLRVSQQSLADFTSA